jgi:hypothetical protein
MLRGLRTRILGLFLHYLRTPAFNPEARKFPRYVKGRAPQYFLISGSVLDQNEFMQII